MSKKNSLMVTFISDPYHAILFHDRWEFFKDEIDQIVVGIAGKLPKVNDFIADLWGDKVVARVDIHRNQGQSFNAIYPSVKNDVVITMDSDNYIFKKGLVRKYSDMIGEYDIIGSEGFHIKPSSLIKDMHDHFGYVRINPFMSFWNREILNKIENLSWETWYFKKGDKLGDYTFPEEGYIDQMGGMSLRAFLLTKKVLIIEGDHYPEYRHPGAMATATRHHLGRDDGSATIDGSANNALNNPLDHTRIGWWLFAFEMTKDRYPDKAFNDEYYRALKRKAEVSHHDFQKVQDFADGLKYNWKNIE